MNRLLLILIALAMVSSGFSQDTILSSEEMVGNALRTGMVDGHVTKYFRSAADAAVVTLIRVLGEKTISDTEANELLVFIADAFSDLQAVEVVANREPKAALFLLKYLDCSTQDPALKARIAATRQSVLSAYSKIVRR